MGMTSNKRTYSRSLFRTRGRKEKKQGKRFARGRALWRQRDRPQLLAAWAAMANVGNRAIMPEAWVEKT